MAAVIDLTVEPEQLKRKAKDVSAAISNMKADLGRLHTAINSTHSYWVGQAGELHRKLYNDRMDEMNEVLKLLGQYPTDLLKMAGIYAESEHENKVTAASLNSTVIH